MSHDLCGLTFGGNVVHHYEENEQCRIRGNLVRSFNLPETLVSELD